MSDRRIAIGFSNCLGNFVIMTSALKILREREKDSRIYMITDEDVLFKHLAVKSLAEKLFDGVVTNYEKGEFDEIYVGNWSRPRCMLESGDAFNSAVWWTDSFLCSGMHEVQVYLDMIGSSSSDFSGFLMETANEPVLEQKRPRIALANASSRVGSRKGKKVGWDKFPELSKILQSLNYEVVLVGQGLELEGCVGQNFIDKLDIFETAKVISQCDLMVCTDTGLMHVADSLGVPLVVLAGPTPMTKAHPLVSPYRIVRSFISCAPCYQRTLWNFCQDSLCMKNIKVDDVLSKVFPFKLSKDVSNCKELLQSVDKFVPISRLDNRSIKIVMPYYAGDERIDAAVNSWPTETLLLAVTDEGTKVPDGYESFYTPDNAKVRGLSDRTKPISKDLFQRLLVLYPGEDFYGYINSDIILPSGTTVESLFPSDDYTTAVHHRMDLNNKSKAVYWAGKDCFVWTHDVARKIADEYPELVIGSCNWDDGLVHWLWKIYGRDLIELRYGEVHHRRHMPGWSGNDSDANYNGATLDAIGITTALRHSYNWDAEYQKWLKLVKKVGIVQPGRLGDILIVLPIAKWYADKGYEVSWPVCSKYLDLFRSVDYVEPLDAGNDIGQSYQKSMQLLKGNVGKIINLGIGFGRHEEDWLSSGLTFDRWKYEEAQVPFSEKYNLVIKRDMEKEMSLKNHLNLTKNYIITHSRGESAGDFNFNKEGAVEVHSIEGYNLFDWLSILEDAKELYCINSCVANLIDIFGIGKNKRYYKLGDFQCDENRKKLLEPSLSSDWSLIDKVDRVLSVAFFTIVFNGMPFLKYHLEKLQKLSFPWHWYIIEGLSQVAGDLGARGHKARGGHIPSVYSSHLSTDGTKEYLDEINNLKEVTLFRNADVWSSKLQMINTPLAHLDPDCLLWQIDVDEFYPLETMNEIYKKFVDQPKKTAAVLPHIDFVGKFKYVVFNKNKSLWGSGWFPRVWRYKSGCRWVSHEPPILADEKGHDLCKMNPFNDEEVSKLGYHHYNYIYSEHVHFKEAYYGYTGLYDGWLRLNETPGRVVVQDFLTGGDKTGAVADDWHGDFLIPTGFLQED